MIAIALFRGTFRSFRNRLGWFTLLIFSATLGIAGILLLLAVQGSIRSSLSGRSRVLMTADLSVSVRRKFTDVERRILDQISRERGGESSDAIELYSMVRNQPAPGEAPYSRLVELLAVDERYPLYGELRLASGRAVGERGLLAAIPRARREKAADSRRFGPRGPARSRYKYGHHRLDRRSRLARDRYGRR